MRDLLDGLAQAGFRRILLCNGHGGNAPAAGLAIEWIADHPGCRVRFHNWWNAPRTWAKVQQIDTVGSHASWMENFPWTRLSNVAAPSDAQADDQPRHAAPAAAERGAQVLGDGNFGGLYQRADEEMLALWDVAVDETRALIEGPWA